MRTESFFVLVHDENPNTFLTICCKKVQAIDFFKRFLVLKHYEHFSSWCSLHNQNKDEALSWDSYIADCIEKEEIMHYQIKKIKYNRENLASILRMFCGCPPVGCKFESQFEYDYIKSKLADQERILKLKQSMEKIGENIIKEINAEIPGDVNGNK